MKFWQKIFTYYLILFLIIFNLGGIFLIENSYNLSLNREIERGLSEHLSIYSGMNLIVQDRIKTFERFNKDMLNMTMKNYFNKLNDEKVSLEILDKNNNVIFSNLKVSVAKEREELKNPYIDKRKYVIRDIGNKSFLFITNLLDTNEEELKCTYIRDVSYIYEDRKKSYKFFVELDIFVSFILVCGTYILSKHITKPINRIIQSIQTIENGDFSERININSNDEIGILANHFNNMTNVIEENIKELKQNIEEKQRFIDNLTHEIKTPLTSIIGYSDFLRNTKYNEEVFSKGLNSIFKEGKRLEKLSSKLMNLILLKKENFEMKKENIKDLLIEVKDILKLKLKDKNIDLEIEGEYIELFIEKDLIMNLIINLMDNAIKASNENNKIYLRLYEDYNLKTVIEVKDMGKGINKDDLAKVFEPFYMIDKSRKKTNGNLGLGLFICEEIAKIHNAKIKITSEINKGTSVKVIFE